MEEIIFNEDRVAEMNLTAEKFFDLLDSYAKKYNLFWKRGYSKDLRVSSMYESFEFSIASNGKGYIIIKQMIHFPLTGGSHTQFKGGLQEPLSLEEAFIYVSEHSKAKYTDEVVEFNEEVQRKVNGCK